MQKLNSKECMTAEMNMHMYITQAHGQKIFFQEIKKKKQNKTKHYQI